MVYLRGEGRPATAAEHDCPFCAAPVMDDAAGLIVHRGVHAYVVMNLYPYNAGHVLVCPYRHIATYDQASAQEVAEIGEITADGAGRLVVR